MSVKARNHSNLFHSRKKTFFVNTKKDAKKVYIEVDPEVEYQRILRESTMTAEEAFRENEIAKRKRAEAIREKMHREDNVN